MLRDGLKTARSLYLSACSEMRDEIAANSFKGKMISLTLFRTPFFPFFLF
jgi:hypothetical protein